MSVFAVRSKAKKGKNQRAKEVGALALSALEKAFEILKEVAGDVGVPGLEAGVGSIGVIIKMIKKTSQNAEDIKKLTERIRELAAILGNGDVIQKTSMQQRISRLLEQWVIVAADMKKMPSRSWISKFLQSDHDAEAIKGHIETITWSIQSFLLEGNIAIEHGVDQLLQFQSLQKSTHVDVKCVPRYALTAPYYSNSGQSVCLTGTRTKVLEDIYAWAFSQRSDSIGLNNNVPAIYWINGLAGTGKTTIAHTVAAHFDKQKILGASFFCSRDRAETSKPGLVFSTIAYQLGNFCAPFKQVVSDVLELRPDIDSAASSYQLEKLIVEPLKKVHIQFPPCIIVLDALDECKDDTSSILFSLSEHCSELVPLRFLITSRPEPHITSQFLSSSLVSVTQPLLLHEVKLDIVQKDIKQYLMKRLGDIRALYRLPASWPTDSDVDALEAMSHGLFIFAATAVKFIADENYSEPVKQLTDLLNQNEAKNAAAHQQLYQLYAQVLKHAFSNLSTTLAGQLKLVLGSIVMLQDPLTSHDLQQLLGLSDYIVSSTLAHLQPVIFVPAKQQQVIHVLHPTFAEFMIHPNCPVAIRVNPREQHTLLARCCLQMMKQLRKNMCEIEDASSLNTEIPDLSERIARHIPPFLQYACLHWARHLMNASLSDDLLELLNDICNTQLIYWVEVCSLLGELQNALETIAYARQSLMTLATKCSKMLQILSDCERFVLAFFPAISVASLHVYKSALLFTPYRSLWWAIYSNAMQDSQKSYYIDSDWSDCLRTMEGHSGIVFSVAFSPDGTHIVSGSDDKTVRLWNVATGANIQTFEGHSDGIISVAFSPDGTHIVSGSGDKTVRLWNVATGANVQTFKGHSHRVSSVAFSPDGTHIVSGSYDKTVRLWNMVTGANIQTFKGHSDVVNSVAFSPDGTHIVSGSLDKTVRLWNVATGANIQTFKEHSHWVMSVAFSHDGTHIVSGSDDKTVRLWNVATGANIQTFKGHSDGIYSVAFSPDGTHIVSGSRDNTVRLWIVATGANIQTLEGHSFWINSVAFSPDGTHIVSGSGDNTVRLWNVAAGANIQTFKGHSHHINSVAFSPDGTHIISGSPDETVQLWNVATGANIQTFKGHSDLVNSVAFSPDGTHIVSGSRDKTIQLWNVATGAIIQTFKGHSDLVNSVAFSPDGTHIVSGSEDTNVQLWNVATGANIQTFTGHSDWVNSVAFSPDGTHIVSGSDDKTVRLWNVATGANIQIFKRHSDWVNSVAFSPDGTHIVSGSNDGIVELWNVADGANIQTLERHSSAVNSVAFSPDGTHIVSGFYDQTVRLWNVATAITTDTAADQSQSLYNDCSPEHHLLILEGSGWLCSRTGSTNLRHRLCWIPLQYRHIMASHGSCVILKHDDNHIIILHVS